MSGLDIDTLKKGSVGFHSGSFMVFILGFSLPYWVWTEDLSYGLWQRCLKNQSCEAIGYHNAYSVPGNFEMIQISMCFALALHFISLILHFSWSCQSKTKGVSSVAMAGFAFSLMTALATVTSVLAFVNMRLVTPGLHVGLFFVTYSGMICAVGPIVCVVSQCRMGAPHGVAPQPA